jgi:hypothetical protein
MKKSKIIKIISLFLIIINVLYLTLILIIADEPMHYGDALGCWYYNSRSIYLFYITLWQLIHLTIFIFQIYFLLKLNFKKSIYSGLIFIASILIFVLISRLTCDSNI